PPIPRRHLQGLLEPPPTFGKVPPLLPKSPQRPSGLLGSVGIPGLDRPSKSRPDIGVLLVAPVQPLALVVGGQMRLGLQGQVEEVLRMAAENQVEIAPRLQLLLPELPDRLQH